MKYILIALVTMFAIASASADTCPCVTSYETVTHLTINNASVISSRGQYTILIDGTYYSLSHEELKSMLQENEKKKKGE